MADSNAENRKVLALDTTDVALVFKEDGHVDLSFPNDVGDYVPDHVMAALSISYAMMDDEFFELIQNRYRDDITDALREELGEELQDESVEDQRPHLTVIK